MAAAHLARDNPTRSEQLYPRDFAIKEEELSTPERPDTAMTIYNLAVLADDQGRCAEAELPYQRA